MTERRPILVITSERAIGELATRSYGEDRWTTGHQQTRSSPRVTPTRTRITPILSRGGHSRAMMQAFPEARLVAFDWDADAIRFGEEKFAGEARLALVRSSYFDFKKTQAERADLPRKLAALYSVQFRARCPPSHVVTPRIRPQVAAEASKECL